MQALYPGIGIDLKPVNPPWHNLTSPALCEHSVLRSECILADGGALVALTAPYTGRSPQDKFIVREPASDTSIWWGSVNRPISEDKFDLLRSRLWGHLLQTETFRPRCNRRCRSAVLTSGARYYRICVAQHVCAQYVHLHRFPSRV